MQCSKCMIDFKRDSEDDIEIKITSRTLEKLAEYTTSKNKEV